MENLTDWNFAIDLVAPGCEYGWLQPSGESGADTNGKYEHIEWRDKTEKPTKPQLETAWGDYVTEHGTPREQEAEKKVEKDLATQRLRGSIDPDVIDLLKLLT